MTDINILEEVKKRLGIVGNFHDGTLNGYIADVKGFMSSAGVPDSVIESEISVGCISRGVADLWNYGAGDAKFSEYFRQRLVQLKLTKDGADNV